MSLASGPDAEKFNPLLQTGALPAFDEIEPAHVLPAIEHLIAQCKTLFPALYAGPATWQQMVAPEEQALVRLAGAWAPVSHMHNVADSPEWREAYSAAVVLLSDFHTGLNQDPLRFAAYQALADSAQWQALSLAQQRQVTNTLRDFRLAGAHLEQAPKERYRDIRRRLTELSTQFGQNLQDASDHWQLHFESAQPLAGLPDDELEQARQRAGDQAGYLINLDYPSFHAVLTYADDRALRETVYRAYHTRASDQGPDAGRWDNTEVMHETLSLRQELAALLGFASYAEYSLQTKMAAGPDQALEFLHALAKRARPRAQDELARLSEFAAGHAATLPLAAWDIGYWSERLRASEFAISDEELRPYFPCDRAMDGLFAITGQLFSISFRRRTDVPVWHDDAVYFDVLNADGKALAGFYVDLYARKGKQGGAWMANCRDLYHWPEHRQQPVAFLNCNFAAPAATRPTLLNHRELTTLFHEFGHALHHMLTRIAHPAVGGINGVEWDAVELPSQFLENWCWEREALDQFARHVDNDTSIPPDLLQRMLGARHFQTGLFLVRQLEFALIDLRLHTEYVAGDKGQIQAIIEQVRDEVAVLTYPSDTRFLHGFGHLFAGGYGAGYYSYLWAEQLAADAFGRFHDEGVLNARVGADFRRQVLEAGGSRPAMESFIAFRGRPPQIGPLLESYGL